MRYVSKISTEQFELNSEGLTGYIRQRHENNKSRLDVSLTQFRCKCPELVIHSQFVDGAITGEHLTKAYSLLMDVKKCEEKWNNWKNLKEEK